VGFIENNVASSLDTTRIQVVISHVEIGGRVAEEDAMERVAIELGITFAGDTGCE
jgi:hypothetical protein